MITLSLSTHIRAYSSFFLKTVITSLHYYRSRCKLVCASDRPAAARLAGFRAFVISNPIATNGRRAFKSISPSSLHKVFCPSERKSVAPTTTGPTFETVGGSREPPPGTIRTVRFATRTKTASAARAPDSFSGFFSARTESRRPSSGVSRERTRGGRKTGRPSHLSPAAVRDVGRPDPSKSTTNEISPRGRSRRSNDRRRPPRRGQTLIAVDRRGRRSPPAAAGTVSIIHYVLSLSSAVFAPKRINIYLKRRRASFVRSTHGSDANGRADRSVVRRSAPDDACASGA